jgi:hypothetical protein
VNTLVIQSHRDPLPAAWIARCLASVRAWAAAWGFDYRFLGDELLARVPPRLRAKTRERMVVATDYARLVVLREAFAAGYERAVWCDADFLVIDPGRLVLPEESYAFGREVWIQPEGRRLRARIKVHNAFMVYSRGNPFLDFYLHGAERILDAHRGPMVPQLVGPKLLTALHNLIGCPVVEAAAMLSPTVEADLLDGDGAALALLRRHSPAAPAGANLSASTVGGAIRAADMPRVIDRLLAEPALLAP